MREPLVTDVDVFGLFDDRFDQFSLVHSDLLLVIKRNILAEP
jgi:hypothetical protein